MWLLERARREWKFTAKKISRKGAKQSRKDTKKNPKRWISLAPLRLCFAPLRETCSLATDHVLPPGRVIHAAEFLHPTVVEFAFDDLVTQQREHSAAQEQWSRIAVPIDARCATLIVDCSFRLRPQFTNLAK